MHRVWRGRERIIRSGRAPAAWLALAVAAMGVSVPAAAVADARPPTTDLATLPASLAYRCADRAEPRFSAISLLGSGLAADESGAAGDALRTAVEASGAAVPSDGWHRVGGDDATRWIVSAPLRDGDRRLIGLAAGADGAWSAVVNEPCTVELAVDGARAAPWSLVPEGWLSRALDRLDIMVERPCVPAGDGRFVRFLPGPTSIGELSDTVLIAPSLVPSGTRARCNVGGSIRVRVPVAVAGRSLVDVSRPQWATRWGPTLPGSTPAPATPTGPQWPGPVRDLRYHCDGGGPTFRAGLTQQPADAQAREDEIGAIIRRWISTETSWPAIGYRVSQVGPDELQVLARAEPPDGTWWVDATIERIDGVWQEVHGYGDCVPRAAARETLYAEWSLDPAYPVRPGDRTLHLRLTLPRCFESLYPVDWVRQPPIVREDEDAVYLVVGARSRDGQTCRGDLTLRLMARLSRPLGDRAIVDANALPLRTVRP